MPAIEAPSKPAKTSAISTLSSSDSITPRSALRHRPIAPQADVATEVAPWVARASRTDTRSHKPAAKTTTPVTAKQGKQKKLPAPSTTPGASGAAKQIDQRAQCSHWLVLLGAGMLIALTVVFLAQLALGWFTTLSDDIQYGRPRTFQTDAFVGHETGTTPSHFIALNLHGHIEIIELPGGDASHARIFLGPQLAGSDAELAPATLQFVDRHHNHHPDMIVQAHGIQVTFSNEQGTFHPV